MRSLAALTILVTAGLASAAAAPAVDAKPRLVVVDRSPLVVRGLGFEAGESVRVRAIMRGGPHTAKTLAASRGGVFSVRFGSVWPSRCSFLTVVATGARGSRAVYSVHPPPCGPDP
jgi:hypothetical protein